MTVLIYPLSFGEETFGFERLEHKIERERSLREYTMTGENVSDVAAKHIIQRRSTVSQRIRETFVRVFVGTDCFASREREISHIIVCRRKTILRLYKCYPLLSRRVDRNIIRVILRIFNTLNFLVPFLRILRFNELSSLSRNLGYVRGELYRCFYYKIEGI